MSVVLCAALGCSLMLLSYVEAADALSAKEARRLIARVAGIELNTNAVRVKQISSSASEAIVVAEVEAAFRFTRGDGNKWRVAEIRIGSDKWEDVELLVRAVNAEKSARAQAELETLVTALDAYRRERGFYIVAEDQSVLVDHLSPRYTSSVLRLDPWHRPYKYKGAQSSFTLRSVGADGVEGTADDIVKAKGE